MSNVFHDPTFLNSVLAMREQMEALRPQYESAARAVEHMKAQRTCTSKLSSMPGTPVAVAVDAHTRAHRDLDRPHTACPQASTGVGVDDQCTKAWGIFR